MVISARLIGEGIDAVASVRARVLDDGWKIVPLFSYHESLQLIELPKISNADIIVKDGVVSLLTKAPGTFEFKLRFLKYAKKLDVGLGFELGVLAAGIQELRLTYDSSQFSLVTPARYFQGDAAVFFPSKGAFRIGWKTIQKKVWKKPESTPRASVDPVITDSDASIVVTLDGQRIARYHYGLRFQGQEVLTVVLPEGEELTKVYLNGISQPIKTSTGTVQLSVRPARQGEEKASLELVLRRQSEPLALSGTLSFVTPALSWSVNHSRLRLHLPNVFNYLWLGGSLSPGGKYKNIKYTWQMPTPGKQLDLGQELVRYASDAQIKYAVDLTDKYFK